MKNTFEYSPILKYIENYYSLNNISTLSYVLYNVTKEKFVKNNTMILKIFKSEYVIFLTDTYFNWYNKLLLKYFKKYDIIYFKYNDKIDILNTIEVINHYIKNESTLNKNIFKEKFKLKNLKLLYFLENTIEPNILYKKISFAREEIFLSFDNYIIKKMEYKLRTFCQIAEKLGAEIIKIKYDYINENNTDVNVGLNLGSFDLEAASKESKKTEENIGLVFRYSNLNHNMNINKYYIMRLIEKESEFFISKEEFNADIDLKFLINSRCINLIQLYNTSIIVNNINKLEEKICAKAYNYGLNIGKSNTHAEYISINISIKFNNIYNNPECINGGNIYLKKEGFFQLKNIIKEQLNIYRKNNEYTYEKEIMLYAKMVRFIKSHLRYIDRKILILDEMIKLPTDTITFYENIFNPFFYKEHEIHMLLYLYFKDNMYYSNFEKFRNIMIAIIDPLNLMFKNIPNEINKYYYLCLQYNNIITNNKMLIDNLNTYFDKSYTNITKITIKSSIILLESDQELANILNGKITIRELVEILDLYYKTIKITLVNSYIKAYVEWNGLNEKYTNMYNEMIIITYNNFENTFKNIINSISHVIKNSENDMMAITILKYIVGIIIYDMNKIIEKNYTSNNGGYIVRLLSNILISYFISYYDVNFLYIFSGFFKIGNIKNINDIANEITKIIDINTCIINYNNYNMYYTWDNFLTIIDYFETKIIKEQHVLKKHSETELKQKQDMLEKQEHEKIERIEIERIKTIEMNDKKKEEHMKPNIIIKPNIIENIVSTNKIITKDTSNKDTSNKDTKKNIKKDTKKEDKKINSRIKNSNFFNRLNNNKKDSSSNILQKITAQLNDFSEDI